MATIPPSWEYPVTDEPHGTAYLYTAVREREQRYENQRQMIKNQRYLISELTELKEDAEEEARTRLDQIRTLGEGLVRAESERDQLQGDVKSLMDERDALKKEAALAVYERNSEYAKHKAFKRLEIQLDVATKDRDYWLKQNEDRRNELDLIIKDLEEQEVKHESDAMAQIYADQQVDSIALKRFVSANKAVVLRQVVKELRSLLSPAEPAGKQYAVSYPSYGEQSEKPGFRFYIWGYGANPMSYRQLPDGSLQWWYEYGKGWRQSYLPSAPAHPLREVAADDLPDEGARAKAYSL